MASFSEVIISVAAVNRLGVLCRGMSVSSLLDQSVVNCVLRECSDVLTLKIEVRRQVVLIDVFHVLDHPPVSYFNVDYGCMVMNSGNARGLQLELLDTEFVCMHGAEAILFVPFAFMQASAEFIANVAPFWSQSVLSEIILRKLCGVSDVPIAGCVRICADVETRMDRLETAVDATGVVTYIRDLPLNAVLNRPFSNVNGMARFVVGAAVVITPKGGVLYADTLLEPCWNLRVDVDARKLGEPMCMVRIKPRTTDVCGTELRLEVA